MARMVLAGELEEVYGLAAQCVDQLEFYLALWEGLGRVPPDKSGKMIVPLASGREIDVAVASLGEHGAKLGRRLKPLRRAIQAVRSEDAWILDITAATEIEAVVRLTEREGGQEPWEGRLDLSNRDHCAVLNRMVWAQRIDDVGDVHLVRFNAEEIKAKLDREAGRVICSAGGEFDHVARTLSGQPRLFFDLLVEHQGQDVTHQMIADHVLLDEVAEPNAIYQGKKRLIEALERDFSETAERIETVPGGYRLN